jgi:hypothetical protein
MHRPSGASVRTAWHAAAVRTTEQRRVRLLLECPECGHRWTVEVDVRYGPRLDRRALCEHCCTELGVDPEL